MFFLFFLFFFHILLILLILLLLLLLLLFLFFCFFFLFFCFFFFVPHRSACFTLPLKLSSPPDAFWSSKFTATLFQPRDLGSDRWLMKRINPTLQEASPKTNLPMIPIPCGFLYFVSRLLGKLLRCSSSLQSDSRKSSGPNLRLSWLAAFKHVIWNLLSPSSWLWALWKWLKYILTNFKQLFGKKISNPIMPRNPRRWWHCVAPQGSLLHRSGAEWGRLTLLDWQVCRSQQLNNRLRCQWTHNASLCGSYASCTHA